LLMARAMLKPKLEVSQRPRPMLRMTRPSQMKPLVRPPLLVKPAAWPESLMS
jgi:hypothetical protein